ncbi:hypothetical protein SAMN05660662_0653 [Blastococcus aurantiacus]|uniref:DUF3817 domain-containing protein n=1 Tax=Blastococcus aurantiacus TaxID=1550231 RepID=A0A1G7HJH5_9ACTN|nr:hypothetical protein [Blastococcus aurantiacus]SDF00511.1 hypothetical protein SAMN05660662_0653 [Blastococcus aurantiacus]
MLHRRLGTAAAVETLSLAALLTNLATAHLPWIASALGPVHGFCYLVVIALAWQPPAPSRVRALSLVPAVGGLLVLRAQRRRAAAVPA